jgi:quinolinate synthase
MKMTTLPKVLNSLEKMQYHVTVPDDVAARARLALERMVAVGGTSPRQLAGVAGFDPGE